MLFSSQLRIPREVVSVFIGRQDDDRLHSRYLCVWYTEMLGGDI